MSYIDLNYHLIFATKERRPWLHLDRRQRIAEYIGGIIRNLGGRMLAANGPEDHLHVATTLDQKTAIMEVLKEVKGSSSEWIHNTFSDMSEFQWQDGYAAFSVSHSIMPSVVAYVHKQQEHHRKMSFRQELIRLFKLHGIQYDERYLPA